MIEHIIAKTGVKVEYAGTEIECRPLTLKQLSELAAQNKDIVSRFFEGGQLSIDNLMTESPNFVYAFIAKSVGCSEAEVESLPFGAQLALFNGAIGALGVDKIDMVKFLSILAQGAEEILKNLQSLNSHTKNM